MSKIVVIGNENCIKVDFGDYAGTETPFGVIPISRIYQKHNIEFELRSGNKVFALFISSSYEWALSFNESAGTFKVDSVNGIAPSSDTDLYEKLSNLIDHVVYSDNSTEVNIAASATSFLIKAFNDSRRSLIIKNNSTKKIWISNTTPAVLGNGIDLNVGEIWIEDKYKGNMYAISEASPSGNINVIELT